MDPHMEIHKENTAQTSYHYLNRWGASCFSHCCNKVPDNNMLAKEIFVTVPGDTVHNGKEGMEQDQAAVHHISSTVYK